MGAARYPVDTPAIVTDGGCDPPYNSASNLSIIRSACRK